MSRTRHGLVSAVAGAALGMTLLAGCGGGSNRPQVTATPSLPSRTASISAPSPDRVLAVGPGQGLDDAGARRELGAPHLRASRAARSRRPSATPSRPLPPRPRPPPPNRRRPRPSPLRPPRHRPRRPSRQRRPSPRLPHRPRRVTSQPVTTSTSPSVTPTPDASATSSDGASDLWWLWALLAAAVAAGIGWLILAASRRRRWDAAFATELAEARWAVDTLVPSVTDRSVPADEITARWGGSQRRLDDLQSELSTLASTAPGTQRSARAAGVSESAVALRQAMAADVALRSRTGASAPAGDELAASREVVQTRSDALRAAMDDRTASGPPPTAGATGGQHER